jgi:hypothetical protein
MIRTLVACLVASLPLDATAHDLITAESAQSYLAAVAESQKTIASKEPAAKRALAHLELGKTLEEIRELLNRDLAAHGKVQGLPSNYLLAELQRQGAPLAWSEKRRRFGANTQYFERSLAFAPRGPHATDAGLRLLLGRFYDSFESDPLAADESWPQLAGQIALAEGLAERDLPSDAREEAEFIGAILHARASLRAPDAGARRSHATRARQAIAAFEARYPDSLRRALMPLLRETLDKD